MSTTIPSPLLRMYVCYEKRQSETNERCSTVCYTVLATSLLDAIKQIESSPLMKISGPYTHDDGPYTLLDGTGKLIEGSYEINEVPMGMVVKTTALDG